MTPNQVFWHRVWLIVVAVLIIAAHVNGFRISRVILSPDYRLPVILTLAASFCIVMGIREFAKGVFNIEDNLWYASFSGFIFISSVLIIVVSIFLELTKTVIDPAIKRALRPEQMQFLIPAFVILWMIILSRLFGRPAASNQYYSAEDTSQKVPYTPPVSFNPPKKRRMRSNRTAIKKVKDKLHKGIGLLKRE